ELHAGASHRESAGERDPRHPHEQSTRAQTGVAFVAPGVRTHAERSAGDAIRGEPPLLAQGGSPVCFLGPLSLILWLATAPAASPSATPAADATTAPADSAVTGHLTPRGVIGAPNERGQMVEPAGVAVDAFGTVWVTDAQLHCLERFDRDGRWLGEIGALG